MATSYTKAKQEVLNIVQHVMHKYHPCLAYVELRVGVLMATRYQGEERVQALKHHGYPAAATIKIVPLKQRAMGGPDVLITIDELTWENLDDVERAALIDHELTHIEIAAEGGGVLVYDETTEQVIGSPRSDDQGRPRCRGKLHDWQLGGFHAIAKRYGEAALEVQAVRCHQNRETGQYIWDFARKIQSGFAA